MYQLPPPQPCKEDTPPIQLFNLNLLFFFLKQENIVTDLKAYLT